MQSTAVQTARVSYFFRSPPSPAYRSHPERPYSLGASIPFKRAAPGFPSWRNANHPRLCLTFYFLLYHSIALPPRSLAPAPIPIIPFPRCPPPYHARSGPPFSPPPPQERLSSVGAAITSIVNAKIFLANKYNSAKGRGNFLSERIRKNGNYLSNLNHPSLSPTVRSSCEKF